MKKILGIVGSPRKGGNTDVLVDTVLKGAQDNHSTIDKVILSELSISPCIACDACRNRTGICIIGDDMRIMIEKMEKADIIVFGTPVYWWGPSAQFKPFMDRWYSEEVRNKIRGKKIIVVIAMGDGELETARHTIGIFQDALEFIGADIVKIIVAADVVDRGDVLKHQELVDMAYEAGASSVK